jgi:6-phosphogluconolactonase (cycloisomerase 2 family)
MALSSGYLITKGNSLKIDPGTGGLIQAGSAAAGKGSVWVAADSSTAYFCADDGIYAYTLTNGSFTAVPGSPFFRIDSPDPTKQFSCQGLAIDPAAPYLISSHQGFFHNSGTADVIKRLPGGVLSPDNHSKGIDKGGPIVVHPNGKFFYIDDDPDLLAFAIDASGQPQIVSMPSIFLGGNPPLAVDPAGKFLFAGGGAKVHVYGINSSTGALSEVAGSPFATGGNGVSGIAVDPNGQFVLIAAGQFFISTATNTVSVMSLNSSTGALSLVGAPYPGGSGPDNIVIAHF